MSGNTSSSASFRSMGYVSEEKAANTVVNVYVATNSASKSNFTTLNGVKPSNLSTSPGIVTAGGKNYSSIIAPVGKSGKFDFDPLSASQSSKTTTYQTIGSAVKLQSNNDSDSGSTGGDPSTNGFNYTGRPWIGALLNLNKNISNLPIPVAPQSPTDCDWNLPPHQWSLPRYSTSDRHNIPDGATKNRPNDRYRRGRIWWKATDTSLSVVDGDGKTTPIDNSNRKFGFQFLWNPPSISTSVAVQMDATPQSQDRFLGTVGAFPATEALSVVLRVDRVNDFACANALFGRPENIIRNPEFGNAFVTAEKVGPFIKYYQATTSFAVPLGSNIDGRFIADKLVDLFQRGTIADIEYLYRAINGIGPGAGSDKWKNGRGIATADIGFLMPTLLNIDIGPLSYIGYVNSLSVTHNMFTPDMIPIQSDLNISLQLLATAGISATSTTSSPGIGGGH